MTTTFNANLADAISRVRQMIGDTDIANALVQDETITAYVASMSELAAAAQLCWDISATFARKYDTSVDRQQQMAGQQFDHYRKLAINLEQKAKASPPIDNAAQPAAFCGVGAFGITAQEVIDARCDPTRAENAPPNLSGGPVWTPSRN